MNSRAERSLPFPLQPRLGKAVIFDEKLLELGVQRALTLHLFEKRHLTLAQAAKLAAIPTEDFMALAGAAGVVVVDYPPEELGEDMATARPRQ